MSEAIDIDLDAPPYCEAAGMTPPPRAPRQLRSRQPRVVAPPPVREPPHSTQAEAGLLACCLIDGVDSIARCRERGIEGDAFFVAANRVLWAGLLELYEAGRPVATYTLAMCLQESGRLDAAGGAASIESIANSVQTTAHLGEFVQTVLARWSDRAAIQASRRIIEAAEAHRDPADLLRYVDELRERLANHSERPRGLTVWSPADFLRWNPPAGSEILAHGLIAQGEITSIVGVGGLGKSRLVLWLALCQIAGLEWCGLPVHGDPKRWLFLSPENGLRRWQSDLVPMVRSLDDGQRTLANDRLRIFALTDDEEGDLFLGDPAACTRIKATLDAVRPDVVVFDPFADMVDGDENKTSDMIASLRKVRNIVRSSVPQAAVIIVHHARTGAANVAQAGSNFDAGNFGRGAKALYSRVRCEIQLAPGDKDDGTRLVLACGKASNVPKFATRGVVFDPQTFRYDVDPEFDVEAWRDDVAGKRKRSMATVADVVGVVAEHYRPGDDVTTATIMDEVHERTGASRKTIHRRIAEALAANYLKSPKRGFYGLGSKPLK